jgi:hypothetical protein
LIWRGWQRKPDLEIARERSILGLHKLTRTYHGIQWRILWASRNQGIVWPRNGSVSVRYALRGNSWIPWCSKADRSFQGPCISFLEVLLKESCTLSSLLCQLLYCAFELECSRCVAIQLCRWLVMAQAPL